MLEAVATAMQNEGCVISRPNTAEQRGQRAGRQHSSKAARQTEMQRGKRVKQNTQEAGEHISYQAAVMGTSKGRRKKEANKYLK